MKEIGSWWESARGKSDDSDQHEIDIMALYLNEKKVLLAEVKRQRKNFEPKKFQHKVELIKHRLFSRYQIETRCLTLEDM